jgi:hypothetical protein
VQRREVEQCALPWTAGRHHVILSRRLRKVQSIPVEILESYCHHIRRLADDPGGFASFLKSKARPALSCPLISSAFAIPYGEG